MPPNRIPMPFRFLCWLNGEVALAPIAEVLIFVADSMGIEQMPVWEIEFESENVLALLAKRNPEGTDWLFFGPDGTLRFMAEPRSPDGLISQEGAVPTPAARPVNLAVRDWAMGWLANMGPINAEAVSLPVWEEMRRRKSFTNDDPLGLVLRTFYHPLGFGLPVQIGTGGWAFVWSPDVVAGHLASLAPADREPLLEVMYFRLVCWTEMAAEIPDIDERERQIDKRILGLEEQPRGWRVMNQVLLNALSDGMQQ